MPVGPPLDRKILGKALGAIANYSVARDFEMVCLIFCDAAPYDQGYMRVRGGSAAEETT